MTARADLLTLERRNGFWLARLNRADKRNALSDGMIDGLRDACANVADDDTARAMLIWGAGGHFCAGADFGRFLELRQTAHHTGPDPIATYNRTFGATLQAIAELQVPKIAIVRGSAMGGGVGLAAVCDRVIAVSDATFSMTEVSIGVAPAQIAPFVIRRVGETRARWLMQSSARLDAGAAVRAGLADVAVEPGELAAQVHSDLGRLAAAEPTALRATARVVNRASGASLDAALDAAAIEFAALLRGHAPVEGIAATRERRAAAWVVEVPDLPDFV